MISKIQKQVPRNSDFLIINSMSGVVKYLTYLGCRYLVFIKDLVLCKIVLRPVTGEYFPEFKKSKENIF